MESIKDIIRQSISIKEAILSDEKLLATVLQISQEMVRAFQQEKKVLFCGNGGSAADAQHLASELSGRFYLNRPPLFAEALHVNTSYLTAVANDYNYAETFRRMVQAKGRQGDVLVALSTSGNSNNVVKAVQTALKMGMVTVSFTGIQGGELGQISQYCLKVPSTDVPRIQECHILLGHIICERVEKELFGAK
jgi:D-sedoheptulose 7-phosphate isomerase